MQQATCLEVDGADIVITKAGRAGQRFFYVPNGEGHCYASGLICEGEDAFLHQKLQVITRGMLRQELANWLGLLTCLDMSVQSCNPP